MKEKIALFCDVDVDAVITARDVKSVYQVPVTFAAEGVDEIVLRLLQARCRPARSDPLDAMLERMDNPRDEVSIGLVGKYVEYEDSYKSLKEALLHGGLAHKLKVNIHWIEAEGVAGRMGKRQLEITTASWCRAASASAASRACSTPSATRASARCRISASAWACRPW
jgi:CTP synthase